MATGSSEKHWLGVQIQQESGLLSALPEKEGVVHIRAPRFGGFIFLLRLQAEARPDVTTQVCLYKNDSSYLKSKTKTERRNGGYENLWSGVDSALLAVGIGMYLRGC